MNKKILWNIIFLMIICFFFISIIPILYTAQFDFATGDDLGYGAVVRHAWLEEHSIISCIKAAATNVKGSYNSWQGTWFTLFLFCFNPQNFGFGKYVVVPFIMMGIQIITTLFFLHRLFIYKLKVEKLGFLAIAALVLFIDFQFIPYPTCGFYWWTGTVHYVIPFSLYLMAIVFTDKYLEQNKIKDIVILCVCMILLGGGSYQAAVLGLLSVILMYLWKRIILCKNVKFKDLIILIPVLIEVIGLIISAKAPGNSKRGGEAFEFTLDKVIFSVLNSFYYAFEWIIECIINNSLVLVLLIIIAIIVFKLLVNSRGYELYAFNFPLLFVIISFCLFAATFTPQIFSGVDVSGGVYNTYLYIFVFLVVADTTYVEGYLLSRNLDLFSKKDLKKQYIYILIIEIVFLYMGRHGIKVSTDYVCMEYIKSGAAEDYKEQMEEYYNLLTTDELDVILPEVNDEQGPLQCMPVTGDISNFTNYVTADYYYKNTVRAIPREEWNSLYNVEK